MRKVEFIMGMPVSVDIPKCQDDSVFEKVFTRLRKVDQRFSPYKNASELTRYQKGRLSEKGLSPEFRNIIQACKKAEQISDGYFSAYFSGDFDPSGYVKGWAISEAGKIIEKARFKTYCIGAGGDILARSNSAKTWRIGIQDPRHNLRILNTLNITNGAVATSGTYERGFHIINPKTGSPADKFLSVTISGPDIIMADVLATAVFAAGNLNLLKKHKDYQALVV